ncbi:hypothetical protein TorRG33x02_253720, partial [Trema orientale]
MLQDGVTLNDMPARYLTRDAKIWNHFFHNDLMPGKHYSNVTKTHMILLFCIITGRSIDIGKIIHSSIMTTLRNQKF